MAASMCRKFEANFYQIFRILYSHNSHSRLAALGYRKFSTRSENAEEKLPEVEEYIEENDDVSDFSENMIEQLRNVSGLSPHLRSRLQNSNLVDMKQATYNSLYVKRKMYAKYGKASGIDARIQWPTKTELRQQIEENKILEPSLQERLEIEADRKVLFKNKMKQREEIVAANMNKMTKWVSDYRNKEMKKLADQKKQEEKKERLLDEAREHFGYAVDYRDSKFKKMMEEKILEEKKLRKKQKKEKKVQRYFDSL